MSTALIDRAHEIQRIEAQIAALEKEQQALTISAWLEDPRTIARAERLLGKAVRNLVAESRPLTPEALAAQIGTIAHERDWYAVMLCNQWLDVQR